MRSHLQGDHRSQISENLDSKEYAIDAGSNSRIRRAAAGPILLPFLGQNSQQYISLAGIKRAPPRNFFQPHPN